MYILITKKLLKNAFFSIFKAHFHQNFQQQKIKIDAPFQLVYGFGGQPQPPNEPELGPPSVNSSSSELELSEFRGRFFPLRSCNDHDITGAADWIWNSHNSATF